MAITLKPRQVLLTPVKRIPPIFFRGLLQTPLLAQTKPAPSGFVLARLKYYGGGDWYNDPSSIPNLLQFMADKI